MNRKDIANRIENNGLGNLRSLGFSDTAILIIGSLEKWFKKYPDGFDKHTGDRQDQQDLDGECWTKELGMDRETFRKYFLEIGEIYNSPYDYFKAQSKFGIKYYCRVLNKLNHGRTKYYRNHELAKIIEEALRPDSKLNQETELGFNK